MELKLEFFKILFLDGLELGVNKHLTIGFRLGYSEPGLKLSLISKIVT